MIDSFITQICEQNKPDYLNKVNPILLTDTEQLLYDFIRNYADKHGKTPDRERLQKEGYGHYLTNHYKDTPLSDILEMVLDTKRNEHFLREFSELQQTMDTTGKLDIHRIAKVYDELTKTYTGETIDLTSYDRKKFYTTEKPDTILFGWDTIDRPTGGILPGEYAVLVARLGVGKSLIAVYLAQMWAKQGKKVLFIPCEMTIEQTMYRIDAFLGGFNPLVFRTKRRYGYDDEYDEKELETMFNTYYGLVNMQLEKIKKNGGNIFSQKRLHKVFYR